MARVRNAMANGVVDRQLGLGVSKAEANGKVMMINSIDVVPRAADFAADVEIYLYKDFEGLTELVSSGDFVIDGVLEYTADFTTGGSGDHNWVDKGGDGSAITFGETKTTKTNCMKITPTAGNDKFNIENATTVTNAQWYKVTFDYFATTDHGLFAWGMGVDGNPEYDEYDQDSGKHPAIVSNAWTSVTLYGKVDSTNLRICAYTAVDGSGIDTQINAKHVWIHNLKTYLVSNFADWTLSDGTKLAWDMYDENIEAVTAPGEAETFSQTLSGLIANQIVVANATIGDYGAGDIWMTLGGATLGDMDANGAYPMHFLAGGSTPNALVINYDATGDGTVDDVSIQDTGIILGTTAPVWKSCAMIASGINGGFYREFNKPLWMRNGWYLYCTTPGASSILDINVNYTVV